MKRSFSIFICRINICPRLYKNRNYFNISI